MKLIDRIFNKLAYKYSKERLKQIEAIDREIEKCNKDIENTENSRYFSCRYYIPGVFGITGDWNENDYEIKEEVIRNIILNGLKYYKKTLVSKKNKLL